MPVLTLEGLLDGTYQHYANSTQGVGANQFNLTYFYNLGGVKIGIPYEAFTESDDPSQGIVLGLGDLLAKLNADFSSAAPPYRLVRS